MNIIAVKPHDVPEEWVFQCIDGLSDIEIAKQLQMYLYSIGVVYFTVTHYSKANKKTRIAIEDICLN